jgi:Lon protease-like protein
MQASKMTIPMFPLKLVVLPGEEVKLHIFEDKYKQLLADCENHDATFGIPVMMEDTMLNIGAEVELTKVTERYEDGEADIVVKGIKLFSIIGFYRELPEKLYGGGQAKLIDLEKYEATDELKKEFKEFINQYQSDREYPTNIDSFTVFDMANHLFLNPIQKLKLINNKTVESREEVIRAQMRFLVIIMMQERNIENNFYPN